MGKMETDKNVIFNESWANSRHFLFELTDVEYSGLMQDPSWYMHPWYMKDGFWSSSSRTFTVNVVVVENRSDTFLARSWSTEIKNMHFNYWYLSPLAMAGIQMMFYPMKIGDLNPIYWVYTTCRSRWHVMKLKSVQYIWRLAMKG